MRSPTLSDSFWFLSSASHSSQPTRSRPPGRSVSWLSPELSRYWSNTILSTIWLLVPLGSSDHAGAPPRASAHCRISAPVFKIRDIWGSPVCGRTLSDRLLADQGGPVSAKAKAPPDGGALLTFAADSVERFALDQL